MLNMFITFDRKVAEGDNIKQVNSNTTLQWQVNSRAQPSFQALSDSVITQNEKNMYWTRIRIGFFRYITDIWLHNEAKRTTTKENE